MTTITHWLEQQTNGPERPQGITAIDLLDLPLPVLTLVRLLLRATTMSQSELTRAIAALPDEERMSVVELDTTLKLLSRQGWLLRNEEGNAPTYRVHLRRKAGSTLSPRAWSALNGHDDPFVP